MDALIVFMRAFIPGRVKTRLARSVGDEAALALYRAMVEDLAERVHRSESLGKWTVVAYVDTPGPSGPFNRSRLQQGTDLFERMANALTDVLADGAERAVLVGTDIPLLTEGRIVELFSSLDRAGAVLGPSSDGGYYAVGFRADVDEPEAVSAVIIAAAGSAPTVLDATEAVLDARGISRSRGPTLSDVDTIDDLLSILADPTCRVQCPRLMSVARRRGLFSPTDTP